MEEIKTCKNCKYFVQHYVIHKRMHLARTNCGHCRYPRISVNSPLKYLSENACCKHWEEIDTEKENFIKQAKECLYDIEVRIRDIGLILNMEDKI